MSIYRVSHFKWAPRITSKEVIFKENNPDKSCCTQRGTSNDNFKIVLNYLLLISICFTNALLRIALHLMNATKDHT